jgi:hypothetical protein
MTAAVRAWWVDLRAGARVPGGAGQSLEARGRLFAKELHAIATPRQRDALIDKALELDGPYLGAILLALALALHLLVSVEVTLDVLGRAVKDIDGRPEQVAEVGFEAGTVDDESQGFEDAGNRVLDGMAFGQGPWIGLVLERTPAVELKLVDDVGGRG